MIRPCHRHRTSWVPMRPLSARCVPCWLKLAGQISTACNRGQRQIDANIQVSKLLFEAARDRGWSAVQEPMGRLWGHVTLCSKLHVKPESEPSIATEPPSLLVSCQMKLIIRCAALSMFLSGCANHPMDCAIGFHHGDCLPGTAGYDDPDKFAAQDDKACQSYGLKTGTPEYADCRIKLRGQHPTGAFQ
jgi:hypothetical protein